MFNEVEKLIIENSIICPECSSKGGTNVSITTTIMAVNAWEDEDRHNHEHDSNQATAGCTCKNGHKFNITLLNSCWCGWKQK